MHLRKKKTPAESPEASAAKTFPSSETPLTAHTNNVAVPEVRTGKVDVDGDFQKEQEVENRPNVSFDTLAVPEYHTGKCPQRHSGKQQNEAENKHHNALYDLARIIVNGGDEK